LNRKDAPKEIEYINDTSNNFREAAPGRGVYPTASGGGKAGPEEHLTIKCRCDHQGPKPSLGGVRSGRRL